VEDREAHRLALVAERARHLVQITETERRLAQIDQRYRISSEAFQNQLAAIAGQMNKADETVAALQNEIVEVGEGDRGRSLQGQGVHGTGDPRAAMHQLDAPLRREAKEPVRHADQGAVFRAGVVLPASIAGLGRGQRFRCLRSPPSSGKRLHRPGMDA